MLLVLGGVAALMVATRLRKVDDAGAWIAGSLVAARMFVGVVLSRTVDLPSFHESEWRVSGLVTLALEGAFTVIAVPSGARRRAIAAAPASHGGRRPRARGGVAPAPVARR